ncbi:MAG: preprotein translocase subunit SecY, partial [Planctomycetaceae bacterium]
MFDKIVTVFRIPELRQKILLTIGLLAVYRMGFWIPLPFIDQAELSTYIADLQKQQGGFGQVMQIVALFSASSVGNSTIFGLGIMPYISASIIFQLMGSVYPPLERLQKEGEAGRKKINEYTRYATVVICLGQSYMWVRALSGGLGSGQGLILDGFDSFYYHIVCTVTMTAGTILLMWMGEQIDAYGIGNGISLLIMAGILARMPQAGWSLIEPALEQGVKLGTETGIERMLLLGCLFVFVVVGVIFMTQGQRRIPIQSAKHVRGRRVMGG